MEFQIVYVLVGNESNFYFEQTCVSAYSVRMYNDNVRIILVVDVQTEEYLKNNSKKLLGIFDKIVSVNIDKNYNNKQKSRYLKTSLRNILEGDFIFIDSDTIICDSLMEIQHSKNDICAVPDKHLEIASHPRKNRISQIIKKIGGNINTSDIYYFNSGVMFVKDTIKARKFFDLWHNEWIRGLKFGVDSDQPSLFISNKKSNYIISKIDGIWNCQIIENGLKYLVRAKILHYFSSDPKDSCFKFKDNQIFYEVRQYGDIPPHTIKLIQNAKSAFDNHMLIVSGSEAAFLETSTHKCYVYHHKIFSIIEKLLNIFIGV